METLPIDLSQKELPIIVQVIERKKNHERCSKSV